jgi:hypothetical protein
MKYDTKRSAAGVAVFGLFFWISSSQLYRLGDELERICPMLERIGDQCRTGADLGWMMFMVFAGSIGLGYLGYLMSGFMFTREKS